GECRRRGGSRPGADESTDMVAGCSLPCAAHRRGDCDEQRARSRSAIVDARHTDIARHAFPAAAPAAPWSSRNLGDRTAHVLVVSDVAARRAVIAGDCAPPRRCDQLQHPRVGAWRLREAPSCPYVHSPPRRAAPPGQAPAEPLRDPLTPPSDYLAHAAARGIVGGVLLTMLLAALDQVMVATALPTIAASLGDVDNMSWVVTANLLCATAATPLYGKLSDIHGRRAMMLIAIGVYAAGSLAC